MRGLALCVVVAALAVTGCGSGNSKGAKAPSNAQVAATGTNATSAGVSAPARVTPVSLCTPEGKGKPKRQCVAGLSKLDKGRVKNPAAACKRLSKKKTKGVRGTSPYAICVRAAARLMASKKNSSSNAADDGSTTDTSADDEAAGSGADAALECQDENGNKVAFDSPDVDSCEGSAGDASGSSSDGSAGDASADTSSGAGE